MQIWGGFYEENFSYIKISVKRCNSVTSDVSCADDVEVASKNNLRVLLPEATVNYDIHDTDKALEWNLHSFYVLQMKPSIDRKQDIYVQ